VENRPLLKKLQRETKETVEAEEATGIEEAELEKKVAYMQEMF